MSRVGIFGSGDVGKTLAKGFAKHGHDVRIGSREGNKLAAFTAEAGIAEGSFGAVATHAEIAVIALAGSAAEGVVRELAGALAGKVVIDAANPIGGAAVNGFLPYFTGPGDSLMQRLQTAAPQARFVKAFNSVGSAYMVNPSFAGGRPTMFIGGDDADAKKVVTGILDTFGWDAEDVGGVESAQAIEALCQLWCAPGFLRGDWGPHAFKVLRG